ncbi:MAG TPA: CCA tRNA nucleotidyltransferase, partial [Streptosporangiaceae bacterium]|nr:CCA tRNA nucleotidyltransferase [Streptosporangiaceae bacterium]
MPVHDPSRDAVRSMLTAIPPAADELGRLFARHGHELALVGGPVRDLFLQRPVSDLDLTTDARPDRVIEITSAWADSIWTVGIAYGTVGLRKGDAIIEITTYRSERYDRESRKPAVHYGTSLTEDLARRDFTVNAMAATLPGHDLVDPSGGLADLARKVLRTPGKPQD